MNLNEAVAEIRTVTEEQVANATQEGERSELHMTNWHYIMQLRIVELLEQIADHTAWLKQ